MHDSNGHTDAFVSKFEGDGDFVWARTWGGDWYDIANAVCISVGGGVYVTGYYGNVVDFDPGPENSKTEPYGSEDYFLLKLLGSGYWY